MHPISVPNDFILKFKKVVFTTKIKYYSASIKLKNGLLKIMIHFNIITPFQNGELSSRLSNELTSILHAAISLI